ncbi:MAG: thiamine phosphate synthase [SAR202 cluster bacterium]|nr:thiamine phosphate synthase [SAR202 cluster bacterium]
MNPFLAAHLSSLIANIRYLEAFVTAPLGLYSDIRMLRESVPSPEAAELSLAAQQEQRLMYRSLSSDPASLALRAVRHSQESLGIFEKSRESPLNADWTSRARKVLTRAEQKVGGDIRAKTAARLTGLYVIVDPEASKGRPVQDVAQAALSGGASVLQLRDKRGDVGAVLTMARALKAMCDSRSALFIMNDDAAIAYAAESHGLHVGQADLPLIEARKVLSPWQILGRSNNSMDEVAASISAGVDYLAVGAIYATSTGGKGGRPVVGLDLVRKAKDVASQPVVAIGGINRANVAEVVKAGADSVCVISAVTGADNPEAAARELVDAIASDRK